LEYIKNDEQMHYVHNTIDYVEANVA